MAQVITVNNSSDFNKLDDAAHALSDGLLVAFPTETVYGLGASALSPDAVKSIFLAKGRPQDNPLIVHIAEKKDITRLVKNLPDTAKKIMDAFMPGPITIVLEKSDLVPDVVTAGGKTVAIRIPESAIARELIKKSGVPIAAPSANISGKPSPTKASHVIDDLSQSVAFIIDGGECRVGLESTVLDLTVTPPTILRPGGITHEQLTEVLGEVSGYSATDDDKCAPKSPGMKYRHYAPTAKMIVYQGKSAREEIKKDITEYDGSAVYVLTAGEISFDGAETINLGDNPHEYSKKLFDALRRADALGADVILAEFPFAPGGIVTALTNRIYKSCGGNIKICK